MSLTLSRGLVVAGVAGVLLLAAPDDAFAQCAMCRTALEQNTEVAAGFNRAILFLLAMPYAVFASGTGYVLLTRHRRLAHGARGRSRAAPKRTGRTARAGSSETESQARV